MEFSWDSVSVPHTWNAQDGQTYSKDGYYRGPGWYAKELDIPATWKAESAYSSAFRGGGAGGGCFT